MAATVTVVTGSTAADVLRAFGADPAQPESLRSITDDLTARMSVDPWVAVLEAGTAVLAVEYNGFQGMDGAVLRRASAGGRAGGMFCNVNAMTQLSFAECGQLLACFEPPGGGSAGPAVRAALDGLDLDDYRNRNEKGLVAVERFTGRGITARDLGQIQAADIAFRITPGPASLNDLGRVAYSPRTLRRPRSTSCIMDAGSWPVAGVRSALSRVTRPVTLTTESFGRPLAVAGRKTLPGMAARPVFDVMTAASVVLSRLAL
jgi:Family of unknown function (DUF6461)